MGAGGGHSGWPGGAGCQAGSGVRDAPSSQKPAEKGTWALRLQGQPRVCQAERGMGKERE